LLAEVEESSGGRLIAGKDADEIRASSSAPVKQEGLTLNRTGRGDDAERLGSNTRGEESSGNKLSVHSVER